MDEDFLSVLEIGSNVVCGSSEGNLVIFKREDLHYDHIKDKKPNKMASKLSSCDTLLYINETIFACADTDGKIGIYKVEPKHRVLGILANHKEAVNDLALSRDGKFIASCGMDGVKFWDSSHLYNIQGEEDDRFKDQIVIKKEDVQKLEELSSDEEEAPKKKKRKIFNSERKRFFSGFE